MSQISGSTTYSMTRGSARKLVDVIIDLLTEDESAARVFLTVDRKRTAHRHVMHINDDKYILVRNDSEEVCESCGRWLDEGRAPHVKELCLDCTGE